MKRSIVSVCIVVFAFWAPLGCREEGPAEKAGRRMDEAIDEVLHGDEGAMERAGRKLDEAIEDAKEELEKARKSK